MKITSKVNWTFLTCSHCWLSCRGNFLPNRLQFSCAPSPDSWTARNTLPGEDEARWPDRYEELPTGEDVSKQSTQLHLGEEEVAFPSTAVGQMYDAVVEEVVDERACLVSVAEAASRRTTPSRAERAGPWARQSAVEFSANTLAAEAARCRRYQPGML